MTALLLEPITGESGPIWKLHVLLNGLPAMGKNYIASMAALESQIIPSYPGAELRILSAPIVEGPGARPLDGEILAAFSHATIVRRSTQTRTAANV